MLTIGTKALHAGIKRVPQPSHIESIVQYRGEDHRYTVVVVCCCFSHSAHWLPTRKKLLYTVANPARGLLNREKKKKKKSGSALPPPPPARCSFGEKIIIIIILKRKKEKKNHAVHPHV